MLITGIAIPGKTSIRTTSCAVILCMTAIEGAAATGRRRSGGSGSGRDIKKRIALPGQGKRGGARTIVATKIEVIGSFFTDFARMSAPALIGTS